MFPKTLLVPFAIGIVAAGIFVGLVLLKQRGATPNLVGEITNVRTLGMDESSSVAIVDFRFTNDSKYMFIVQDTAMSVVDSTGEVRTGAVISASDANRLLALFPAIGGKTADALLIKNRVAPQESRTAMLAARFEISKASLDARQKITVSVHEVDGAVSEISR